MARGTTLSELVTMVREEAGHSTNAALGQNVLGSIKSMIRRQQEILWLDHAWPHMRVQAEILAMAGQRYYTPPAALSLNHRIDQVAVFHADSWHPVEFGIDLAHYNAVNPDSDDREDPVRRYALYNDQQIELWPLPATNNIRVRFTGTKNLTPLVADADLACLDDQLIVLFVAAELAAKQKQENSNAKLQIAQQHYRRLKGSGSLRRIFRVGGNTNDTGDYRSRPRYGGKL